MEWQDGVDWPLLAVASPSSGGDWDMTVDVVATCGADVLSYSFDAGLLAEADTAYLEFPELDAVADWQWLDYGAHLFVRLTLSRPEDGQPMRLDSAPERWLVSDGSRLQLISELPSYEDTADGETVIAYEEPPVGVVGGGN
jgi:hypothetical protein